MSELATTSAINKTKASKNLYAIDPKNIHIPKFGDGFHKRTASNYGDMQELVESVKTNGVLNPITVRKVTPSAENGNREYELVFGFRRMQAVAINLENGVEVPYINAIVSKATEEELLFQLFAQDTTQVQLNLVEQADVVASLLKRGYEIKDLPEKVNKSLAQLYKLKRIAEMPIKVKKQISTQKISQNAIFSILNKEKDTDKIASMIESAVKTASTSGEKRATAANVPITSSSNDKRAPFEKLKTVYRLLHAEGLKNEKMSLLGALITKSSASVEEIAEYIRGGKAPEKAEKTIPTAKVEKKASAPKTAKASGANAKGNPVRKAKPEDVSTTKKVEAKTEEVAKE